MAPGSRWVYRETDSEGREQRVVVTVTAQTKRIANGIEARVVHDVVTEDGEPVEVTDDWYAQDSAGNIWYLGEDTTEYENGKPVSTAGSFEAGVDGAQPGVIMPAEPEAGLAYRQEYYAGEAEDTGEIVSLDEQAEVPFGHFTDVLMTKDMNPLEPKVLEFKFYARGVGPVLAIAGLRRQRPRGAGQLLAGVRGKLEADGGARFGPPRSPPCLRAPRRSPARSPGRCRRRRVRAPHRRARNARRTCAAPARPGSRLPRR